MKFAQSVLMSRSRQMLLKAVATPLNFNLAVKMQHLGSPKGDENPPKPLTPPTPPVISVCFATHNKGVKPYLEHFLRMFYRHEFPLCPIQTLNNALYILRGFSPGRTMCLHRFSSSIKGSIFPPFSAASPSLLLSVCIALPLLPFHVW